MLVAFTHHSDVSGYSFWHLVMVITIINYHLEHYLLEVVDTFAVCGLSIILPEIIYQIEENHYLLTKY